MVDEENKLAPAELGGSCSGKRRALPPRTLLGPQFPWRTVSLFAAVAVYRIMCLYRQDRSRSVEIGSLEGGRGTRRVGDNRVRAVDEELVWLALKNIGCAWPRT